MDVENNKYETPKQQMVGEPGSASATAQSILERGAEVYGQAEQAVSDVYDKTAQAVSETYEQAKSYSSEKSGQDNSYRIRDRSRTGVSLGCKLSSLAYRPVCPTRGQRALRHCSGVFPLNRLLPEKDPQSE